MTTNRIATVVTGDRLKWLLAMILAWLKASMVPMTLTSAVSFCRPMKSLSSGGMIRRTAWGTMTKRRVCM